MKITPDQTVGEIAAAYPETVRIFELRGIDYCCGGKRALAAVCHAKNIDRAELIQELRGVLDKSPDRSVGWTDISLKGLLQHIVSRHHAPCRLESARLLALLNKVVARHGAEHPELEEVQRLFSALSNELSTHMLKEEQVLFPFIERLEQAKESSQPGPSAFFGSVNNPIRQMIEDHEDAGVLSDQIRELTQNYAVPEAACNSYRALLHGLAEFERDLHVHVHLENNILFPRACDLEKAA
jgi:regulator of cell morphogenesis and NO signaling